LQVGGIILLSRTRLTSGMIVPARLNGGILPTFGKLSPTRASSMPSASFSISRDNDYRLVVAIDFDKSIIWIKWIGTHKEYDHIDAAKVEYD
jgi:hypothetical protein